MNLLDAMTARLNAIDPDAQRKLAKAMKESDLRDHHIKPRARAYGWLIYWTWNSRNSPAGFPDIILVHPVTGRMVVRELKRVGTGKAFQPRPDQQKWLDAFTTAGVDAGVWTPADLYSGEIDRVLREGATSVAPAK